MAQLSIIVRGLRAEGWLSVAGDVSYGPSSAIGMCAGGWWRFWGQKTSFLFALQDDVSEHAEGSFSGRAFSKKAPSQKVGAQLARHHCAAIRD